VKRFGRTKDEAALEALWTDAVAEGKVPEALWALMTHPQATAEFRALAYEDVHMLSHQIGAGLNADLKALAEARTELAQLRRDSALETERQCGRLADRDARIRALKQQLADLAGSAQALAAAEARILALEADAEHQASITGLRTLEARADAADRQAQAARAEAATWRARAEHAEQALAARAAELAERDQAIKALERLAAPLDSASCAGDCGDCDDVLARAERLDLGRRRILCVGGRGSTLTHYRGLVERCNGDWLCHDGGLEDKRARLDALLAQADAVICPADNVSHDAYQRTKRYCKRHGTPCMLLERSGIATFARALSELAQGAQPAVVAGTLSPTSPLLMSA
jgi:hypothetical protein